MSVDEMIKLLLSHAITDRVFGGTSYDTIIAALKAGQAMRENYYSSYVGPRDNPRMDEALQAWDAATKE